MRWPAPPRRGLRKMVGVAEFFHSISATILSSGETAGRKIFVMREPRIERVVDIW